MKKQILMIGIFALSLASGFARAEESDQGPSGQATESSAPNSKEHQPSAKAGGSGAESSEGANSGTIAPFNTEDPNLAMYQQGAPDDYLVWCEKCGKFVPASAMRLANRTAARPSIVSAEMGGNGGGALNKNNEGEQ